MVTIVKDLRARFKAARDQGARPTCLAFALSDAHAAERPPLYDVLSVDYLYYHALRRMPKGHGDNGVALSAATDALKSDGQPIEADWQYSSSLPSDLTNWQPPAGLNCWYAAAKPSRVGIDEICSLLDRDIPSIVIFMPTERFYYADQAGFLPPRPQDQKLPQSHAVVAVGYGTSGATKYILIRNSWGSAWGSGGYAWLDQTYLSPRLASTLSILATP